MTLAEKDARLENQTCRFQTENYCAFRSGRHRQKRRCVLCSASASPYTQSLLSWLALSRRPARYQEGRGAENWALATGTESAAEPTGEQQQNGKKGAFLPRRQTCSRQRWACLCLQRVAVMFEVLLLGLLGWFRGHSATQGRMWIMGFTLTLRFSVGHLKVDF